MLSKIKSLFSKEDNLQHAEEIHVEELEDAKHALSLVQAQLFIEREGRNINEHRNTYSNKFLHRDNYDDRKESTGRENYGTYEIMDNADGAAILDIYASATITNSAMNKFRPYQVVITPHQKSRELPQQFWDFIDLCERNSNLFVRLYGMVRDGYKYGASYEKFEFEPSVRYPNRDITAPFQSLPTPEIYPLHAADNPTVITEYYRRKYIFDYYDRENFLNQDKPKQRTNNSSEKYKTVIYQPRIIMPFFHANRSNQEVGQSIFKPMIDTFHSQRVSEAKLLLQRITRSSQKLIHHLETEGVSGEKIRSEANLLRELNRKTNSIRELDSKLIQKQLKVEPDEDIYSLMRNGKGSVTALSGDGDIKALRDITHWRSLQYTIAHIPSSYIVDPDIRGAGKEAAAEVDKLFERIISNGRQNLSATALIKFYQTCIDLYFNQLEAHKGFKIEFRWAPISTLEEMRREKSMQIRSLIAKIWRMDMDIPDEFIYKHVFKMTPDEIEELKSLPKPNPASRKPQDRTPGENSPTAKSNNPKQRNRDQEPASGTKEDMILKAVNDLGENKTLLENHEINELIELLSETIDKI